MRDRRGCVPALGLFVLAPLVAEYLLGNVSIVQLPGLIILAPLYGGPALLIREVARRSGRGWRTIVLLGAAFGLVQAGIVDQSLFNSAYGDHELLAELHEAAYIQPLGLSVYVALGFVVGHAIWSMSVPIALVETLAGDRRTAPWLGRTGVVVTIALYLVASALIFSDTAATEDFLASPGQILGATVVVLVLVGAALTRRGHHHRPNLSGAPLRPWLVGLASFFASSAFVAVPPNWLGVIAAIAVLVGAALVVDRWSRKQGWDITHRLALAGGPLLTQAWISYILAPFEKVSRSVDLAGDIVFTLAALAFLVVGFSATRRLSERSRPLRN